MADVEGTNQSTSETPQVTVTSEPDPPTESTEQAAAVEGVTDETSSVDTKQENGTEQEEQAQQVEPETGDKTEDELSKAVDEAKTLVEVSPEAAGQQADENNEPATETQSEPPKSK